MLPGAVAGIALTRLDNYNVVDLLRNRNMRRPRANTVLIGIYPNPDIDLRIAETLAPHQEPSEGDGEKNRHGSHRGPLLRFSLKQ
jgi:hypothetical protein